MATSSPPMALDGYIVESVGNKQHGEQNAPPISLLEPIPIIIPEQHAAQAVCGFVVPEIYPADPTPLYSGAGEATASGTMSQDVQEEAKEAQDAEKHSRNSSSSDDESKKKRKHHHRHHHHGDKTDDDRTSSIPYELKHGEVVSDAPILSTDAKALGDFLRLHGFIRPNFSVMISGTHTETRTRWVQNADGRGGHNQQYTETTVDFSFSIDLSPVFEEDPVVYTVRDDTPAFRGGMKMAVETGGARPIERRTYVDSTTQSAQRDAIIAGRSVGRPPWLVAGETSANENEANFGLTPEASSRTFEEWLKDYILSRRVVKEFKFFKEIFGWDLATLEASLERLVRSTGYSSSVRIKFQTSPENVHVFSPNAISKIFASYLLIFLTSITLVFPLLWMWRRWWPGAGGKWEISGAAFRLKWWELVPGTHMGETEQVAAERLGGAEAVKGKRLRAGKEGVWMLKGVHEADWFRSWEESIRFGVKERTKVDWLSKRTMNEVMTADTIASGLDHLW